MLHLFNKNCAIQTNNILGRFVVAVKDILPGEVILMEEPVIVSPQWWSQARCANCLCNCITVCNICNVFPLCPSCASHDDFDCKFLKDCNLPNDFLINNFIIFGPLKFLLLMGNNTTNPELKDHIMKLEYHQEKRRNSEIWKIHEKNIVRPLLQIDAFKRFSNIECNAELIHKICGIFDVNSFEIRGKGFDEALRGLYPNAALLAHSCVANTLISVDYSNNMKIYANTLIKEGDVIYYNYTNVLLGTDERQFQLSFGKFFKCDCKRCKDPEELGTHLSSLTCQNCGIGFLTHSEIDWRCANCFEKIEDGKVKKIISNIKNDAAKADGDIRHLEMLIKKYSPILNPNHYIIIDLKQNIASILKTMCSSSFCKPNVKVLERRIQLCKEIIPVIKRLEPGISRLTGIAMYEYFEPFYQLIKDQFENLEISTEMYHTKLREADQMLKESIEMLLYEQIQTPEGQLARKALLQLADLRNTIKNLSNVELKKN